MYIDILQRWNRKLNLTSVRQPEEIVTRHFGESLFAGAHLFAGNHVKPPPSARHEHSGDDEADVLRLVDVGSGAGFPGLPLKIWWPRISATLIESNHRKAAFLREVIRSLTLTDINVFTGRAEDYPPASADMVTLRAVERFEATLSCSAHLVAPKGRLALLIGGAQAERVPELLPQFHWNLPIQTPLSSARVLLTGFLLS